MIYSMTGYGKGEGRRENLHVTVEIRSVNHRYADISVKLPRSLIVFESKIRKQVGKALQRGKIDIFVNYELAGGIQATPVLNHELAAGYHELLAELQSELGLAGRIWSSSWPVRRMLSKYGTLSSTSHCWKNASMMLLLRPFPSTLICGGQKEKKPGSTWRSALKRPKPFSSRWRRGRLRSPWNGRNGSLTV